MDVAQTLGSGHPPDASARETQPLHLLGRDNAVLPIRQTSKGPVRPHFFPHSGHKRVLGQDSPQGNICSVG
jgi:hypothetical protein